MHQTSNHIYHQVTTSGHESAAVNPNWLAFFRKVRHLAD